MRNLSQFVAARLRRAEAEGSHPDADLLTAFAEQSIRGGERTLVMEHLAACANCRNVVALAMPELQVEAAVPARASGMDWFRWPALRWAALAAGILAVTSVGVVSYQHESRRNLVSSSALSSSVKPPTANLALTPEVVPGQVAVANPDLERSEAGHSSLPRAIFRPAPKTRTVHIKVAAVETQNQIAQNQMDLPIGSQAPESFDVVKAKDPVPLDVSIAQWAVTPSGSIERSYDQGRTWESISLPSQTGSIGGQATLLCVTTNGSDVWAGGAAGTILHSADGGDSWTRPSPADGGVSLTGDVASIQFSDPQHGTISTSNGELWTTLDAGKTWRKQ